MMGVSMVSCLGVLFLARRSSPAEDFRPPPSADVSTSYPEPTGAPLTGSCQEFPIDRNRLRNPVFKAEIDLRNTFRAQIREAMTSSDPTSQDRVFSLLAKWVQSDPSGAARFATSLQLGIWRELIICRVAQDWAAQDLASAEGWAARLPYESEQNSIEDAICFQVAQTDGRQAVEIAEQYGLEAKPGAVLDNLVQQWAGQDISGAYAWIMEHPAGEQRDQLLGRLAYVESQTEPAAAADLVAGQISTGSIQSEAVMSVLHQWAVRDMTSATAWVDQFPPGALRDRAEAELQGLAGYSR